MMGVENNNTYFTRLYNNLKIATDKSCRASWQDKNFLELDICIAGYG